MIYNEIKKNIFTMPDNYTFVHCISADAEMSKGIAVEFNKRFDLVMTKQLAKLGYLYVGDATLDAHSRVISLVTKVKYSDKPTYATLQASLNEMLEIVSSHSLKHIAMPRIGCGLDRLSWGKVREMILNTFDKLDIEITVCIWR